MQFFVLELGSTHIGSRFDDTLTHRGHQQF